MNATELSKASRTALIRRSRNTGNRHLRPAVGRDEAFYGRTLVHLLAHSGIVPGRDRRESVCLSPIGTDPSPRVTVVGQPDLLQTLGKRETGQQGFLELRRAA